MKQRKYKGVVIDHYHTYEFTIFVLKKGTPLFPDEVYDVHRASLFNMIRDTFVKFNSQLMDADIIRYPDGEAVLVRVQGENEKDLDKIYKLLITEAKKSPIYQQPLVGKHNAQS